jgi:hypothetical protein
MQKVLMNEAERFLINNWEDARVLEKSMADVREKYKGLLQQFIDFVKREHPELDCQVL